MHYVWLLDLILIIHFAFILFVILGGLVALRWHWVVWLHLPAVLWASSYELLGLGCPLTPWEHWLAYQATQLGYQTHALSRWIYNMTYISDMTRLHQILLGVVMLVFNGILYFIIWRSRNKTSTGK